MNSLLIELNHHIGKKVAKKAGLSYKKIIQKSFPDKESYVRFPFEVKNKKIFILADLAKNPNEILFTLLLMSKTLKRLKAKKIYLIAPYMAYLRQDEAFYKNEAISGVIVTEFLSDLFDGVIVIDPHLHRVKSIKGFFKCKTKQLSAANEIAKKLEKKDVVLVGPDSESKQWVETIAKKINKKFVIASKIRYSSRRVNVNIKKGVVNLKSKDVVIIDDIASTGHTIIEAAKVLKKQKVKSIECYCVHGLFMKDALKKLNKMGIKTIASNTIKNPVERIDISGEIVKGVKEWL